MDLPPPPAFPPRPEDRPVPAAGSTSGLGGLIVRDLGKLTQVLAKHREAIVAELRPGRPASSTLAPAFNPSQVPGDGDAETPAVTSPSPPDVDASDEVAVGDG